MKRYKNLIFAGTFDHFHLGHKKVLEKAFEIADHVSIFITTKKLYQSKLLANLITNWDERKRILENYLNEKKFNQRISFFKLDNIYGSSVEASDFDSILVTDETYKNALRVNKVRTSKGLKELKIVVEPIVLADDGKPVTSERIRMGEIDREGKQYQISNINTFEKLFRVNLCQSELSIDPEQSRRIKDQKYLKLPVEMREELRKPLGKVISGSVDQLNQGARRVLQSIERLNIFPPVVISVGDIITISLLREKFMPDVIIVDLKSRRQPIEKDAYSKLLQLDIGRSKAVKKFMVNQASTINFQAAKKIKLSLKNFIYKKEKTLMQVEGEEDLLALPAILFAPLHSVVLYGQWNLGVVMVEATEEKKKDVRTLLGKFK